MLRVASEAVQQWDGATWPEPLEILPDSGCFYRWLLPKFCVCCVSPCLWQILSLAVALLMCVLCVSLPLAAFVYGFCHIVCCVFLLASGCFRG